MNKSSEIPSSTLPSISTYQRSGIQLKNQDAKSKTAPFTYQSNQVSQQAKKRGVRSSLTTVCLDTKDLPQYKYIPPRPPKYIHLNIPQNQTSQSASQKDSFSKTFPTQNTNFFTTNSQNIKSESMKYPNRAIKSMQLDDIDNSDYCIDASIPRVPELPVKMKIRGSSYKPYREKPTIKGSYLKSNKLRSTTQVNRRVQLTANIQEQFDMPYLKKASHPRPKTSIEGNHSNHSVDETETPKTSSRIGTQTDNVVHEAVFCRPRIAYQKMAVKYFLDAGDDIGCFSTQVYIPLPTIYQKATIKYQVFDSPDPPTTSPRSLQINPEDNQDVV